MLAVSAVRAERARRNAATERRARLHPSRPIIEIMVQSPRWTARADARLLVRRAIQAAASKLSGVEGELAVVLTDDSSIRRFNRHWRGKDAATDVLSFPARRGQAGGDAPQLLGDVVIAYETARREAQAERKPFAHHLTHLAVHGFLHLLGYDHRHSHEAEIMEGLEAAILASLGMPDPYACRR